MNIIYIDKIPAGIKNNFVLEVQQIAKRLGVDPNWLMQVFYAESKVNPQAVNKTSGATGLIQFMPDTARGLGTSTAALAKMNAFDQLKWVEKYFQTFKGKMKSFFDVYLAVFFPAAIGKSDDYVFATKRLPPNIIATQNPAININKDGKITMAEFKQYIINTVPKSLRDYVFSKAAAATSIGLGSIIVFFCSLKP